MPSAKTNRTIGAIIILIGAVILIAALFMPWYAFKTSTPVGSETQNSYPGIPSTNGTIQYSCSGSVPCPSQTSYSNIKPTETNTGNIAETGFFLLIVGAIFGIIGTILGLMARGNARRVRPAYIMGIIALILALITPVLFAAALPSAISGDIGSAYRPTSSGPWSSFSGSTSATLGGVPYSFTWGPTTGWYLSFAAFVILLIGVIFLLLSRKEPSVAAAPSSTTAAAKTP